MLHLFGAWAAQSGTYNVRACVNHRSARTAMSPSRAAPTCVLALASLLSPPLAFRPGRPCRSRIQRVYCCHPSLISANLTSYCPWRLTCSLCWFSVISAFAFTFTAFLRRFATCQQVGIQLVVDEQSFRLSERDGGGGRAVKTLRWTGQVDSAQFELVSHRDTIHTPLFFRMTSRCALVFLVVRFNVQRCLEGAKTGSKKCKVPFLVLARKCVSRNLPLHRLACSFCPLGFTP